MIGSLAALGSACLWAVTNTLVKMEAHRLDVVAINAYRATVGSLLFLLIFLLVGDLGSLATIPPYAIAALVISVIGGMAFGDTLNFRSMVLIGLTRSFPIAGAYPLFTLSLSAFFLDEGVGLKEFGGALVTLTGVMLVALREKAGSGPVVDTRTNLIGVGMALGAAMLWAVSSIIVKVGLNEMDVITASAIRLPAAAAVLWVMILLRGPRPAMPWTLRGGPLMVVLVTGLLGSGLSSYLWLLGVQEIGAARSAILSSTSPIFAVPLSFFLLGERPSWRVLLGTLLSVTGIMLVVWR